MLMWRRFSRVSVLVGVKAQVAELQRGEEAALGPGMERFTPDDEPGAGGELGIVDETGELGHRTLVPPLAVLAGRRHTSSMPMASKRAAVTRALLRAYT